MVRCVCRAPTGRVRVDSGWAIQSAEGCEDTPSYERARLPTVTRYDSADQDAQQRPHDRPHQKLQKVTCDGAHRYSYRVGP